MATVTMDKWATLKMFAPDFDATATYAAGVWVNYGGKLWKCHAAVETAGAWTGATNWTEVPITDLFDDVSDIKTDIAALIATSCEIVVTCVTQDGVAVTGQTVTLYNRSSGAVYDTLAYNGQPVTFKVPAGFRYLVEVSSTLSGHFAPTSAEGIVTTNTTAVTLTYSDISHITTYADIKGAMDSITTVEEGRAALVGIEIADTWTDENGTVYSDPMIVQDVQEVQDDQGNAHLAAIMMRKYATKYDVQFDAPEQQLCNSTDDPTAVAGIYYWGYGAVFSTSKTYAVNAYCSHLGGIWKCATAISTAGAWDASKWTLVDALNYSNTKTYAVGTYAKYSDKMYCCTTAVETAEDFDATKWEQLSNGSFQTGALTYVSMTAGSSIDYSAYGAWYKTDYSSSNKDVFAYGYNNWKLSAFRQYLNSAGAVGEWWYPTHVGDRPPNQASSLRGYKAGCSAALLQHAKMIRVPNGTSPTAYTEDVFFLPSGTQMFGAVNSGEGEAFKCVQDATGWSTAQNGSNAGRVYRRVSATGTAVTCWLRSAVSGYSNYVWYVATSGNINNGYYAYTAFAGLPACAIF